MAKTVSSGAAIKTLQLRLKDKHSGFLRQQACAVNFAWNFVNELSAKHVDQELRGKPRHSWRGSSEQPCGL